MSKNSKPQNFILSLAPTTRGFGYAVLDDDERLVDWGVKTVTGNKNAESLTSAEELLAFHQPGVIVLQNTAAKDSRRAPRIRELTQQLIALATTHNVKVKLFAREKVMRGFFADGAGTKQALAEMIAARFPDELNQHVPPKRRLWTSEGYWMCTFDAVALALMPGLKVTKKSGQAKD